MSLRPRVNAQRIQQQDVTFVEPLKKVRFLMKMRPLLHLRMTLTAKVFLLTHRLDAFLPGQKTHQTCLRLLHLKIIIHLLRIRRLLHARLHLE
jgi:hypothetical protein